MDMYAVFLSSLSSLMSDVGSFSSFAHSRPDRETDIKRNLHCVYRKQSKRPGRGLLVDVGLGGEGVLGESLGEPEGDLLERVLDRVGSVADVSAHVERVVTSDRSRGGREGVGGCNETTENESARERW